MDILKRTLTVIEEAVLKDTMASIQDWIDAVVDGQINKCKKRMCREWRQILYADESVTQIPNDDLVSLIIARDDYKTRAERDKEQEAVKQ